MNSFGVFYQLESSLSCEYISVFTHCISRNTPMEESVTHPLTPYTQLTAMSAEAEGLQNKQSW